MPPTSRHIVLTGGGTGGHLFPGLAVARRLVDTTPDVQITFAGSGKLFEQQHVCREGFEYVALPCRPLPRRIRDAFSFFADNVAGYLAARNLLAEQHVSAVVGLGGFASVPTGRAAIQLGLPLILLEQNAVPGRATRWLARSASHVCVAFAATRSKLSCQAEIRVTGNPIRSGFGQTRDASINGPLLVLGGTNGARSLNENVPRALYKIRAKLGDRQIVHQSGESDLDATRQLYRKLGLAATVVPFIADMPKALSDSYLAVCRAGGTTLAELAAAGRPAILLPYPYATDDHQRKNADVLSHAGAAVTVDLRELPGRADDHLAQSLSQLLDDPQRYRRMSA
ncbi:MAG TPA: UDP-N-acetylglucosamine--N-acetylmuramyl-(pentapeptide) pyrophosphoryl-undecaprenol N-acetylglucosamine transferase, partial [Thermoguttaceae bacterium]|nr:UDP-N-acetylglucosamine--N-acetylmuramyl-(pentapeptide) pyrophosphoryl-undecaprenol N-acetylglucosamine transferase [Thermoguttaceae bacterium]